MAGFNAQFFHRNPRYTILLAFFLFCSLLLLVPWHSTPMSNFVPSHLSDYLPTKYRGGMSLEEFVREEEQMYQQILQDRQELIRTYGPTPDKVDSFPPGDIFYVLWDFYVAGFNCPHRIQRLGNLGDGRLLPSLCRNFGNRITRDPDASGLPEAKSAQMMHRAEGNVIERHRAFIKSPREAAQPLSRCRRCREAPGDIISLSMHRETSSASRGVSMHRENSWASSCRMSASQTHPGLLHRAVTQRIHFLLTYLLMFLTDGYLLKFLLGLPTSSY